ncbi:MAG: serine acetyltransferase [Flavobacteriaceae bacterium]|nr:MAG: serine acetyltransferase [Flavobacteriaceae bacterium]
MNAYKFYYIAHWLYKRKIPLLPKIIRLFIFLIYNSSIPYEAVIGKGSFFAYGGIGVVIHKKAIIGKNCLLGSNITIGGKSGELNVPVIGDNVIISSGAKVLGPIKIGNNVSIGANAVVVKDFPNNVVVAGVPAKILKNNIV